MPTLAHSHRRAPPAAQEADLARVSGQRLPRYRDRSRPLSIRVIDAEQEEQPLDLPAGAVSA